MGREASLYIVTYDIPQDRRRNRVAKMLLGFGERIQESVFECYLDAYQLSVLLSRLQALVRKDQDNVRVYALCGACEGRVHAIGREGPRERRVYIV